MKNTFYRRVMNSKELEEILTLPKELVDREVEILILATDNENQDDKIKLIKEMRGAYKDLLSSSEEISKLKKEEKLLEEGKFDNG